MPMEHNWNKNQILLHGCIAQPPRFSHTSHGADYYTLVFAVSRLSGTHDEVNVLLAETLLDQSCLAQGDHLTIAGEVRSFNNHTPQGRRLIITVFAHTIIRERGCDVNTLQLAGTLCKPPNYRRTPLGRDICDMMIAINRSYGRTDYLPCISWGSLAQRCGCLTVGTTLSLEGRLQSRIYTKKLPDGAQERTAFEISVGQIELLTTS
ncbi:MAG: single-stranded DNA-binding protein [Eubacteriales bacterium]